jgi:hypothetical protein
LPCGKDKDLISESTFLSGEGIKIPGFRKPCHLKSNQIALLIPVKSDPELIETLTFVVIPVKGPKKFSILFAFLKNALLLSPAASK